MSNHHNDTRLNLPVVGILGGTFNPIHFGHLRLAQELAEALDFDEIRFIPSANPPHKPMPTVTAQHRAEMVKIAIADNTLFTLETCELERVGASYTFDTLKSLRNSLGVETSICLIMGSDAFLKLDTWHRWQELLDYCHIVLVQRPNQQQLSQMLQTYLETHYTEHPHELRNKNAGYIHMQAITALDISSTSIRQRIKSGLSVRYLLPDSVIQYTTENHLYI
jgi:nicotinate-nucleotide adenylyltransferase